MSVSEKPKPNNPEIIVHKCDGCKLRKVSLSEGLPHGWIKLVRGQTMEKGIETCSLTCLCRVFSESLYTLECMALAIRGRFHYDKSRGPNTISEKIQTDYGIRL